MLKKFFLVSLLFIAHCYLSIAQKTLRDEISKIIRFDTEINYDLTPGFIIGIIDQDSTYIASFGKSLDDDKGLLSENDIFELASLTKPVTIALIHILVNEGKVALADDVNKFFDTKYRNPRLDSLTVLDLINQKSPFPKRPSMFGEYEDDPQNPYASYSKDDLLTFYSTFVPEKFNSFNYSHVNFALLELIIESVCKTEYQDVVEEKIFKPLGMQNSFFHFKEKKSNVVTQGIDLSLHKVKPWTFNSFAASEGLKSSLNNLLKFSKTYSANSGTYLDSVCPKLIYDKIASFNEDLYYTSGWYAIQVNKRTKVIASSGRTNGHSSFIGMVPENKTIVIVLSNSSYGTMDLGMLILRMINNNWKRKPQ